MFRVLIMKKSQVNLTFPLIKLIKYAKFKEKELFRDCERRPYSIHMNE